MSDNRESYDPVDRFSEHFRQRLETYPVPPDEHCWDEIEAHLQKKRRLSPLWIGLSIAASFLVAVLVFSYFPNGKDQDRKENAVSHKVDVAIDRRIMQDDRTLAAGKIAAKRMLVPVDEAGMEPDTDDEKNKTGKETSGITDEEQQDTKEEEKERDEEQEARPEKPYRTFENITAYTIPDKNKRNKHKGWQLSAGLSSVGGFSSFDILSGDDMVNAPTSGNEGFPASPGNGYYENPGIFPEEKITDVKPAIPFSAGITVRRKWNEILGVETGLVYTRLSSDLTIERNQYAYDAVLNLYYIGVPVHLTVDLWEKNRVNLYASGGGMVEKGLRFVYRQKMSAWNDFMKQEETGSISGLQWSLNGGIGISYNFYGDMNLYVEPGISYYFDCNQPVSKRTEDPLSFSLRAGIRYDF